MKNHFNITRDFLLELNFNQLKYVSNNLLNENFESLSLYAFNLVAKNNIDNDDDVVLKSV